jgi:hypothetical protein
MLVVPSPRVEVPKMSDQATPLQAVTEDEARAWTKAW